MLAPVLLEEALHVGVLGVAGRLDPVVEVGEAVLPVEPDLPGLLRQEVLVGEAVGGREAAGPCADEEDAVGLVHDEPGDLRRRLDAGQGRDGARAHRPAVHDGGVQLDDALLVRDAAVADSHVVRIELGDVDAGDGGVERVLPLDEGLACHLRGLEAVGGGDDDEAVPHGRRGRRRGLGGEVSRQERGGSGERGRPEELAAGKRGVGHYGPFSRCDSARPVAGPPHCLPPWRRTAASKEDRAAGLRGGEGANCGAGFERDGIEKHTV